ncbi:hypothetical protein BFL28_04675 [Sphingomonas turrisvirgatae]|uniref:Aspartyl/asparaginy/proline hydroxylase domain-containing protein n=2 Tax=Sphingomonas turrisvirgatae TaxID=1888892 RepID=A0A1E3LS92_9SPHN|nr:hypothetical protein BFL28_04675 [Sphingomonas turrisvirgatae]
MEGAAWTEPAAPLRLVARELSPPTVSSPAWLTRQVDRVVAASSLVPMTPLLDIRAFPWTCALRGRVAEIAHEASAGRSVEPRAHPLTAALLGVIPGLVSARFVPIEPGVHAMARPKAGRMVLTCHLGLVIPREGDLRLRVGKRTVRWAEGETLMFDETQADAWWNDGDRAGLVLALRVRRPLRQPGRWLADRLLRAN